MMVRAILITILALLPATSFGADDWSNDDTAREVVYQVVAAVDWGQTRYIAKSYRARCIPNPGYAPGQPVPQNICRESWGQREVNPVLGIHPSIHKVNAYFVVTGLAHVAISHLLSGSYRKWFQYVTIGVEAGVVRRNVSLGIKVDWP